MCRPPHKFHEVVPFAILSFEVNWTFKYVGNHWIELVSKKTLCFLESQMKKRKRDIIDTHSTAQTRSNARYAWILRTTPVRLLCGWCVRQQPFQPLRKDVRGWRREKMKIETNEAWKRHTWVKTGKMKIHENTSKWN